MFLPLVITLATVPIRHEFVIAGVKREALIARPAKTPPAGAPVVFAYHGHGGTMRHSARKFRYHELWPEAVVVYPQGLPTPGQFDAAGSRNGWQKTPGDQGDRDLKFFDALLTHAKAKCGLDPNRVYACGHSNGGGFSYLLWCTRGESLAALAPSASGCRALAAAPPRPVLHVAGKTDTTVPFANQERTVARVRAHNDCAATGQPWGSGGTLYPSAGGAPVVFLVHAGDHQFPDDVPAQVVKFFQQHTRPAVKLSEDRR